MSPAAPRNQRPAAVKRSILVKAAIDDTWRVFEDEEKLRQWYFDDLTMDMRPGGILAFEGPEGRVAARVDAIDPPRRLVLTYDAPWWGTVTWSLLDVKGRSTRVHVVHEGFEGREEWMDRFAWGWEDFLKNLKAVAEGRTPK